MNIDEKKALIKLLGEADNVLYKQIFTAAIEEGEDLIPYVEMALAECKNIWIRERYEYFFKEVHFGIVYKALKKWNEKEDGDILEAFYWVSKFEYPNLELEPFKTSLANAISSSWIEMNDEMTALEQIKVLNRVFFEKEAYQSERNSPFDLSNLFLNTVVQNKKGNDISLGILYQYMANRLNIPLYGVNFPTNFLLAYINKRNKPPILKDVLFYINPFYKGVVFNFIELEENLREQKFPYKDQYAEPSMPQRTILRLLATLVYAYTEIGLVEKAERIKELKAIFLKKEL